MFYSSQAPELREFLRDKLKTLREDVNTLIAEGKAQNAQPPRHESAPP